MVCICRANLHCNVKENLSLSYSIISVASDNQALYITVFSPIVANSCSLALVSCKLKGNINVTVMLSSQNVRRSNASVIFVIIMSVTKLDFSPPWKYNINHLCAQKVMI